MDFVSSFVSVVIVAFFLSNYFWKYREEKKKDFTFWYVFSGFVLECLIILSFILNNTLLIYISFILFCSLSIFVFINGLIKINNLNKMGKSNKECIILGLRETIYVLASLFLMIQYILCLLYKKLFMK